MTIQTLLWVLPLLSACLGAFLVWLWAKGKIAVSELQGRSSGELERVQLSEKNRALSDELGALRDRAAAFEARVEALLTERLGHLAELAQLRERAQAIPELQKELQSTIARADTSLAEARELDAKHRAAAMKSDRLTEQVSELGQALQAMTAQRDGLQVEIANKNVTLSAMTEELAGERRSAQEKLATLQQARQELSDQFKALANEILDEKSKKFTEQNQSNLGQLLGPLREQITQFKAKVEEVYVNEGKDRSALAEQVKQLMGLNQSLSQDANNLALAIRGDRKAQGNWGEIILDDVLARAGLVEGMHYQRQTGLKADEGLSNVIPDVVINLPGDRHLVVDSKLTLPDYRAFTDAHDELSRAAALKKHLTSIRNHIRGLSEKSYQNLYGLRSLDFVVMFVPLEPAFMLAVTNDSELFQHAWERNVLLVSPSTLLFVVRTVANLWRQEDQTRNAKEISNRGAELYDRLVGFITELEEVGSRLNQAQASFTDARKKLYEGRGNVVRQAEMLRELGVKPTKLLPTEMIQRAIESDGASQAPAPGIRSDQNG
ncbi:MAG: DNA recombination protein RmuC [Pseudomonadota bacterium]